MFKKWVICCSVCLAGLGVPLLHIQIVITKIITLETAYHNAALSLVVLCRYIYPHNIPKNVSIKVVDFNLIYILGYILNFYTISLVRQKFVCACSSYSDIFFRELRLGRRVGRSFRHVSSLHGCTVQKTHFRMRGI
jgi:hypothetical protein